MSRWGSDGSIRNEWLVLTAIVVFERLNWCIMASLRIVACGRQYQERILEAYQVIFSDDIRNVTFTSDHQFLNCLKKKWITAKTFPGVCFVPYRCYWRKSPTTHRALFFEVLNESQQQQQLDEKLRFAYRSRSDKDWNFVNRKWYQIMHFPCQQWKNSSEPLCYSNSAQKRNLVEKSSFGQSAFRITIWWWLLLQSNFSLLEFLWKTKSWPIIVSTYV